MGSYNFFINPKNLNLQMARKAMSTQTLCDRAGITKQALSQFRTGENRSKPDTLGRIAQALYCEVEYLILNEE
mgnify:FL=1